MELLNVERLNPYVQKVVAPYCRKMKEIHGENLKAMFIYGSATGKDFIRGKSNINLLAIFQGIDFPDLKKSLKLTAEGRKKGILAPLMLTLEHIRRSSDTFPIEFLEMKENHLLLYGEDFLTNIEIDPHNLRLECEEQIKAALIRLYEVYLETGMKERQIQQLLINSLTSLIPIMHNLLRLKGKAVPAEKLTTIDKLTELFSLNRETFHLVWEMKQGKKAKDLENLFADYLKEIEKLGIAVDRMEL